MRAHFLIKPRAPRQKVFNLILTVQSSIEAIASYSRTLPLGYDEDIGNASPVTRFWASFPKSPNNCIDMKESKWILI